MNCARCGREFSSKEIIASISGSIMGDEYTDSYCLCPDCHTYTVACWRDNFTGVETMELVGPITEEAAREKIALIRQCDTPWDKKCRCEAHCSYFNNSLD